MAKSTTQHTGAGGLEYRVRRFGSLYIIQVKLGGRWTRKGFLGYSNRSAAESAMKEL